MYTSYSGKRSILSLLSAIGLYAITLVDVYAGVNEWTTAGPYGGNIISLAICPSNSRIMFASSGDYWAGRSEGVFKTMDGGEYWHRIDFTKALTICFAFDMQNPSILYAGTVGDGVFKTIDGGITWTPASDGLSNLNVKALAANPLDGHVLYAGTGKGVYKSSSGGMNWLATTLLNISVTSLAIHPTGPDTIFAATDGSGLYRSRNGGDSWGRVGTDGLEWISCLAISPSQPRTIYANGYMSTDGGESWVEMYIAESEFVRTLKIDPRNAGSIYAGIGAFTTGNYSYGYVIRSTDGGATWNVMDNGMPHLPVWCLAFNPMAPDSLYAGSDGSGIFITQDKADYWTHLETGVCLLETRDLAFVPAESTTLVAATNGGIFQSTDYGLSWRFHSNGLTHLQTVALGVSRSCPSTLYAGTGWAVTRNFFKSTDGGLHWGALGGFRGVYDIEVNPLNCSSLYVAAIDGLFKSGDGGTIWTDLSMPIYRLAIGPYDTNVVYAGDYYSGMYKTTNGGDDWCQINDGLTNLAVCSIVIDPLVSDVVYVATNGGGVFKSLNAGSTWQSSNDGLTNYEVRSLAIDPIETRRIYAGTRGGGVFLSVNGGESWEEMNTGLEALKVVTLAVDPKDHAILYAGTVGDIGGVWTYTFSDMGIDSGYFHPEVQEEYALSQNYPNPFNPETEIEFGLPEAASVKLTVYDILGQLVDVLVDSEMEAGYHKVSWYGGNAASGVYFYRLVAGDFTMTKRMLLLK